MVTIRWLREQIRQGKTIYDLPLRVTFYARVSTEKVEQQGSLENQIQYYTEFIQKNPNWTYVPGYIDEGISGTSTYKRDSFLRMIEDAKRGMFDFIITKEISRFSRNTLDSIQYTQELLDNNVGVLFQNDNINTLDSDSEFRLIVMAGVAQDEVRKLSERLKFGFRQSIKNGHVLGNNRLWGYDKKDCKLTIIPEQAEIIRLIFNSYLQGDSLQSIKAKLETAGALTARGNTAWSAQSIQRILQNEKYCGDVLLQKTFTDNVLTGGPKKNTGQLPQYYIENNHEGIVTKQMYREVQAEIARRNSKSCANRRKQKRGRYNSKYALSERLYCGECGSPYKRVTWNIHGRKEIVWRCVSRLDYGKKYCEHSPTLDEAPLQQAILNAVNASMSDHGTLSARLMSAMEQELAPIPGESMSLGDIDRAMEELGKQFDKLLGEAANADDAETYVERFQSLSEGMEELKRRKASILQIRQEQDAVSRRLQASAAALDAVSAQITEWDEKTVYQLLEKVTVMEGFKIRVTFRNGHEIEQSIDQPKRRKRI